MDRVDTIVPPENKPQEKQRQESTKKDHQYGYSQPQTERLAPGVDADEDRKTSTDATGGPDKPTA